jgi:hypothetical protein
MYGGESMGSDAGYRSLTYVIVSGYVPMYLAEHCGLDPARVAARGE